MPDSELLLVEDWLLVEVVVPVLVPETLGVWLPVMLPVPLPVLLREAVELGVLLREEELVGVGEAVGLTVIDTVGATTK